ncbi:MAG: hypothetical protein KDD73_09320 [Anaerolineales bacterium]|nr:hypothetical protein [Anaerolineales bacterium]
MEDATPIIDDGEAKDVDHTTNRELLASYLSASARGLNADQLYPDVVAHLARCDRCRTERESLMALLLPVYDDELPPASGSARADLAFLRSPAPQPARDDFWWINSAGQLLIQFSQRLLDATRLPTQFAGALRGHLSHRFELPAGAEREIAFSMAIYATSEELSQLHITIDDPRCDPLDLAGYSVTLSIGERRWSAVSDGSGHLAFADLPTAQLAAMRIEVQQRAADS